MKGYGGGRALTVPFWFLIALAAWALALGESPAMGAEVTLQGSLICNGACVPDPKMTDHVLVLFAIDGNDAVRAEVAQILKDHYPAQGLDTDAAQKFMDQFSARLKYYLAPDSPALKDAKNTGKGHYCMPATATAVTGTVSEKDGKRWITATRLEPCKLHFPARMLAADKPSVMPSREPLLLKIDAKLTLKCIHIPAGTFLMGTPFYMWPYHVEEYPHRVTLTRDYYLAEIPITQAMYHVRKSVVDPHYPPGVENARSQRTGRGIVSDRWSMGTHEFITEKADYAGQKFRIAVEIEGKDGKK